MMPDNPTYPWPLVKEPPKDDSAGGPLPNDDIKEPTPDPKKIAHKPADDPIGGEDVPKDLQNLNSA